nr:polymeric immunoglobulin receptor precursor [Equus caballus]ACX69975.1 polymeric immunoglobulin receptor [Equus caballus]
MMFFFLTCLLAVFPVVSMKSPIFGPPEIDSVEGTSTSIKCYYPPTSVNRHSRKYWCRQGPKGQCTTLISSNGYVSKDYEGRANLTNFPESGTFVVNIDHLVQGDSGSYKCGVGINNRGLSFDVRLRVVPGSGVLNGTQVYAEDLGGKVSISCPFTSANLPNVKSVCKQIADKHCIRVIDSAGYKGPNYEGRAKLIIQGTTQTEFFFVIDQLQVEDDGKYVCQAGDDSSGDKSNVDLHVLKPEPELVYADLGSSVRFDCALGPEVVNVAKFLCQENKEKTCNLVANTLGQWNQAFKGRILSQNNNGVFSVDVTNLRKEDAGLYLCGANSDGQPRKSQSRPIQAWQLFVNEETTFPSRPSVVKGVVGGSVAVLCPYNPKEVNSVKSWCRWEDIQNSGCPPLVQSTGLVKNQYEQYNGRLVLYDEPGNGTYTVILNQLTAQDAGFYWCLTNGDIHWRSMVELKIVEGQPNLKVPKTVNVELGETVQLTCHSPCKFYSYKKFWCKWTDQGCSALPSQDEGSGQAVVNCDQNSQLINLTLKQVTKGDEGWYWCGVKEGLQYRETVAVYVAVKEKGTGSGALSSVRAAAAEDEIETSVRKVESEVVQDPRLSVDTQEKDPEDAAGGSIASADPGSSAGQGGSSKVVVSTLVPLALVLALGVLVVGVLRARHRKNVDRISIRSYRTDISMSDFENSRDFGANDNMGASPVSQETTLGGKDEFIATTENTVETEEPKKAKRSSKEEADMAYTAFLLQANNMAANIQDGPSKA